MNEPQRYKLQSLPPQGVQLNTRLPHESFKFHSARKLNDNSTRRGTFCNKISEKVVACLGAVLGLA